MPNKQFIVPQASSPGSGGGGGGSGTVTSVAMTGDGTVLNTVVPGSPITVAGTLAPTLKSQNANVVLAGPTSGGATTPTFRSLVAGDLPAGTGTVTSVTFTGDGVVLSSTPSSAVTTSGTVAAALANAAGGTVLGNNTTSSAAPAYTTAPVLGIPGTSTGTIALASSTASGKYTITAPANAATPTLTLPTGTGTFAVTASSPIVLNATTGNLTAPTAVTSSASLTSNAVVIGAGSQASQTLAGFTTNGTAQLTLGAAGTGTGALVFAGTTSGTASLTTAATGAVITSDSGLTFSGASGAATTIATSASNANLILTPNGTGLVQVPAGSSSVNGIQIAGGSAGIWGSATAVNINVANSGGSTSWYNGSTLNAQFILGTSIIIASSLTNSNMLIEGRVSTGTATPCIQLGNTNATEYTATSGNQLGVQVGLGSSAGSGQLRFRPASGTATFQAFKIGYEINQTGGANGTVTDLLLSGTETALVGTHNALDIGTAGNGGNFTVNAAGLVKNYAAAATVGQGVASQIVAVDLTAQTAAITATNLTASAPRTGMYRVTMSATITTAATTGAATSTLGGTNGFQIGFTSPTDSVAKTTVAGNSTTSAANTTGTAVSASLNVYAKTGTAITYAFDYASNTAAQMAYELHIRLEAL